MGVPTERPADVSGGVSGARAGRTRGTRRAGGRGVRPPLRCAVRPCIRAGPAGPGLDGSDATYTAFYSAGAGGAVVSLGLYVVPFAGIACLWHMTATRTLLQVLRPGSWAEIPHWLHLASGVLFVAMLFVGTAAVGAVALQTSYSSAPLPSPDVARTLTAVGYTVVFVYGVRAAGMCMITTTGLVRSAGLLNRAAAVLSYLAATFLLVSTTFHPAILLVFPAWVLLLSIVLLVRRPTGASR